MGKKAVLPVKSTLDTNPFSAGLKSMKKEAAAFASGIGSKLKSAFTSPLVAIGGLVAGAFSVGKFAEGIKGALDLGGSLEDLKNQTGESADKLLYLQQVLKDNGVDGAMTGDILNKMQTTIAGAAGGVPKMTSALDAAHLSFQDLINLSPADQFRKIGAAITALDSPLQRIRAAREIFGKSGGSLLGALGDKEGFGNAAAALGRQAQLLDQNSAVFDRISDRLGRAGLKLQGFFVGVASTLAPALDAATERLENLDLASMGERFGTALKNAADYVAGVFSKPEEALSAFGNYMKGIAATLGNMLVDSASRFYDALEAALELVFDKMKGKWIEFSGVVMDQMGFKTNMGDIGKGTGGAASANFDTKMADILGRKGKDIFGASDYFSAAKQSAKVVKEAGEVMLAGAEEYHQTVAKAAFQSTSRLNTGHGGLKTGSMQSYFDYLRSPGGVHEIRAASLIGTHDISPLLSAKERRKFEDQAVASGQARESSAIGGHNSVRRGDSKRRKEFLKEQERQKLGLDKTNQILEENVKQTKRTADQLASWGPGKN